MKYTVNINGKMYEVEVEKAPGAVNTAAPAPQLFSPPPQPAQPYEPTPVAETPSLQPSGYTEVKSPMPGSIWEVSVSVGQSVNAGETLVTLEAMKMENEIVAPCAGVVNQILISKGTMVEANDVLVVLQ